MWNLDLAYYISYLLQLLDVCDFICWVTHNKSLADNVMVFLCNILMAGILLSIAQNLLLT